LNTLSTLAYVFQTHRQGEVIGVAEHSLGQHQLDFGIAQQRHLEFDAAGQQAVVVAQNLYQLALGTLQQRHNVAAKAQTPGIALVVQTPRQARPRLAHNGLDGVIFTVVAHQHFKVGVGLIQCGVERLGEVTRIERRNDDAD